MRINPGVVIYVITCLTGAEAQTSSKETDINKCCQRRPNSTLPESDCVSTRLLANQFQNSIVTPGFPQPFPPDTFCKWEVHAPAGRRIWLDFRNIYLIRKEDNKCKFQKLFIRSPLTGLSMGPYCGHDGLPNIVSTGNHLIVELQSPYPTDGRQYKGFKMVYMETVQSTSPELRPIDWSDGMFINSNKDPFTRPPRFRPTARTTPKVEEKPPAPRPTSKKTPKKKPRPSPVNRISSQNFELSTPHPVMYRPIQPPPRTHVLIPRQQDESTALGTEGIVGIIVGSIVAVAIISVVVAKVNFYRSEKRIKREEDIKETNNYDARVVYQKSAILPNTVKVEHEKKFVPNQKNLLLEKKFNNGKHVAGRSERRIDKRGTSERKNRQSLNDHKKDERAIRKKKRKESSNSKARRAHPSHDKKRTKNTSERHPTHSRSKKREHRKKEVDSERKEFGKRNSRR